MVLIVWSCLNRFVFAYRECKRKTKEKCKPSDRVHFILRRNFAYENVEGRNNNKLNKTKNDIILKSHVGGIKFVVVVYSLTHCSYCISVWHSLRQFKERNDANSIEKCR